MDDWRACFVYVFIVFNIAKESKAGKEGTLWLLAVLCMGVISYIVQVSLEYILSKHL